MTLHGRGAIVSATKNHLVFSGEEEKESSGFAAGDALSLGRQPRSDFATTMTEEEAWLLGVLVAEGYISASAKGRITCSDDDLLAMTAQCWDAVSAGWSSKSVGPPSGFGTARTPTIELRGNASYLRMLRNELYTRHGDKRIPKRILNAAPYLQIIFLEAYNLGDGLRAGHGVDQFKSFRTTSPVLAAGLVWLARTALGRRVSIYRQKSQEGFPKDSYLINLNSGVSPGAKGAHLRKPQEEVRKVEAHHYTGWMCDLATESGRFAAGVGFPVIHNSPRRGETFVTRKITRAAGRIKMGLQDKLYLGNLDAQRDWGYAGDFVEAMWMMLQRNQPDDFVIATGESRSVRDVLDLAFGQLELEWERFVEVDPNYFRPTEVDYLQGDPSKARKVLGWEPRVDFEGLMKMMVDHDLEVARQERLLSDHQKSDTIAASRARNRDV